VHLVREGVFFVPLGGIGPKLLLCKVAHSITNHSLIRGEQHGASLNEFEGNRCAFAAANAQGGQAFFQAACFERVNQRDHDART